MRLADEQIRVEMNPHRARSPTPRTHHARVRRVRALLLLQPSGGGMGAGIGLFDLGAAHAARRLVGAGACIPMTTPVSLPRTVTWNVWPASAALIIPDAFWRSSRIPDGFSHASECSTLVIRRPR